MKLINKTKLSIFRVRASLLFGFENIICGGKFLNKKKVGEYSLYLVLNFELVKLE